MKPVCYEHIKARETQAIQHQIDVRADELRVELATLCEIRERLNITQVELAVELGIGQDSVSCLEKRNDTLVSTLRKAVEAMGGDLHLIAELPDRVCIELAAAIRPAIEFEPRFGGFVIGKHVPTFHVDSVGLSGGCLIHF